MVWGSSADSDAKARVLAELIALHYGSGAGEYDVSAPGQRSSTAIDPRRRWEYSRDTRALAAQTAAPTVTCGSDMVLRKTLNFK